MPTQEDRVLARMRQVSAYLRDQGKQGVYPDTVDDWAYATLGIRPRTCQMYIRALITLGNVIYDSETKKLIFLDITAVKNS